MATKPRPPPGDPDKHEAIVRAARRAFLKAGYDRTSLVDVAATAGVSKQTIYNHYADKEALFLDVIREVQDAFVERQGAWLDGVFGERPTSAEDVERTLKRFGHHLIEVQTDAELSAFRKLVNAEIAHHPKLKAAWSAGAPVETLQRLAEYLEAADELGLLAIQSPLRAASQLIALVSFEAQVTSSFGAIRLAAADAEDLVAANVGMFLRAYRP